MSSGFKNVSKVYDRVIGAMDYSMWTDDVLTLVKKHFNLKKNAKILDVGCGTGGHLKFLEKKFRCVGVDVSQEMIDAAKQKKLKSKLIVSNMQELNLGEEFDVAICIYDVLNNLKDESDLKKTFEKVYAHLVDSGVFVFDIITLEAMRRMNDFQIQASHTDGYSYIWENSYKAGVWTWKFTVFSPNKNKVYDKFVEKHEEYYHSLDDVKKILRSVGFSFLEAVDAYTLKPVSDDTERINIICKKLLKS